MFLKCFPKVSQKLVDMKSIFYLCNNHSPTLFFMATSFGFQLATSPNKKGLYPVVLRITQDRKQKKVRTSLEVKKADWNQRAKNYKHFRSSCPEYAKMNDELRSVIDIYEKKYRSLAKTGRASAQIIVSEIQEGEVDHSFLKYAKERTQDLYDTGSIRNWKKYNGFCNKLESFLKKRRRTDLLFSELTPGLLAKFDTYLHKLPNERNPSQLLHPNTIQVVLNIFKTIVNRAITIDNMMKFEDNPFLKFKYKGVKTVKEKLEVEELEALQNLDLPEGSLIWNCRNYFFFSLYCAGIRAGDFIQLRWMNVSSGGRLHYQMGKNHKDRDLELLPQALDILTHYYKEDAKPTDYIFPMLDNNEPWAAYVTQEDKDKMPADLKRRMFQVIGAKNALINKELHKMKEMAGIDKPISFHISRHSFAKMAKDKGLDNLEVKALLAHSNLATTQRYMGEFDTAHNDAALEKVFLPTETPNEEERLYEQLKKVDTELLKKVLKKLDVSGIRIEI